MAVSSRLLVLALVAALLAAGSVDAGRSYGRNKKHKHDNDDDDNHGSSKQPIQPTTGRKLAIAHRGSSGELPEHTIEAYKQAIALGADFVECDLVLTKDARLFCRHEPNLSNTTNADDLFPDRIKTYTIDFGRSTGVHAVDLTAKEMRTLKARQRLFARDQSYNDIFAVPSFEDYLDTLLSADRTVGGYPETKHSAWHNSFKLPAAKGKTFMQLAIEAMEAKGYRGKLNSKSWLRQPIFIQSFETKDLRQANTLTDLPLVQLYSGLRSPIADSGTGTVTPQGGATPGRTYSELVTDEGLAEVARYADAIGPDKGILAPAPGGIISYTTNLVKRAQRKGLNVHPYTARNEPIFFADNLDPQTVLSEYQLILQELGANGIFSDFVESVVFYNRFRRQNVNFPKRQIFPQVDTSENAFATL